MAPQQLYRRGRFSSNLNKTHFATPPPPLIISNCMQILSGGSKFFISHFVWLLNPSYSAFHKTIDKRFPKFVWNYRSSPQLVNLIMQLSIKPRTQTTKGWISLVFEVCKLRISQELTSTLYEDKNAYDYEQPRELERQNEAQRMLVPQSEANLAF